MHLPLRNFALLLAAALLVSPLAATAAVVEQGHATFSWTPAPGDVLEYGVWVVPAGGVPAASPTQRVSTPRATITRAFGSSVRVSVAAFYAGNEQGPTSPPSAPIHFRAPKPAPFDVDGNDAADVVILDPQTRELRSIVVEPDGLVREARLNRPGDEAWDVAGSADFDGDGLADLLMLNPSTGAAQVWFMHGQTVRTRAPLATMGESWFAHAIGDHEPDGTARVLWHDKTSGRTELWQLDGSELRAQIPLLTLDGNWNVWANCDIDGNGFRDVVWLDSKQVRARVWMMDAGGSVEELELEHPGAPWSLAGCGAPKNSNHDIVFWQMPRFVGFWTYSGTQDGVAVGDTIHRPVRGGQFVGQVGDMDGDEDADLVIVDPASQQLKVRMLDGIVRSSVVKVPLDPGPSWEIVSW